LGFFFSDIQKVRQRTEMVILIRPYVMNNNKEEVDVNQLWLEKNSIHPSADNLNDLDIYKNSQHLDKGFELQPDYKVYPGQDSFDDYHLKGEGAQAQQAPKPSLADAKQATYVELTQYAAKSVHAARGEVQPVPGIYSADLGPVPQVVRVLNDPRLTAVPVGSWRKGGVYVTALEVSNTATQGVPVDYRHLQGQWLAATVESEQLTAHSGFGDSTYLYLISSDNFANALNRGSQGGR
ncbi:MAG: DUF3438 family protein, partial [Methyloprofundus sp.]|nr:DUF3438 family protein [Methyloprofundus sp.]